MSYAEYQAALAAAREVYVQAERDAHDAYRASRSQAAYDAAASAACDAYRHAAYVAGALLGCDGREA